MATAQPGRGPAEEHLPNAETGNASNPTPQDRGLEPQKNQLIDERGEKYLREVASPEDYPDPQEAADAEKELDDQA